MTTYRLVGFVPYEEDRVLFSGTEDDLRHFIRDNLTYGAPFNGKEFKHVKKVAGYFLDDLEITIQGPDVRDYLE